MHSASAVNAGVRVDYVSPLPPVRSGIADYSRDLLPRLADRCDLRVIALPGQPLAPDIAERFPPVEPDRLGEGGRLPLYQMGNNSYHEPVWKLAHATAGVVTLHDVVLHHLLVEATLGRGDRAGYVRQLEADHGWIGRLIGRARRWGELSSAAIFELPAHRELVRGQRGIVVHSRWAALQVAEESPDVAIEVVPMAVPLPQRVSQQAADDFRRRFDLPARRPLLGSFGFQTPIKRTQVAVAALAEAALGEAHLVIAGEVSGVLELESLAAKLGVADRVHLTGFLDYRDFETAIAACDLCLNLRYPTAGETSASLLRVLALGRPAVVSDYAQFAELPDTVVIKVPLGDDEVADLATRAGEALADRSRLERMGDAARSLVRELHDPERAAGRLVEACTRFAEREPPPPREVTVPPPTTMLWRDLPGEIEVSGGEAPWAERERRELVVRARNRGPARWLPTAERPGGVVLAVEWRRERGGEAMTRAWVELPRAIDTDEEYVFRCEQRRPPGAVFLVVEPHVENIAGFSKFGGPSWVGAYE